MDWTQYAKELFNIPKPVHFTRYQHCCECAEHDATLLAYDVDTIGLAQLGHPSWDPLCFASVEALLYYMPALIRLTLETMDTPQEQYLPQLLFHLIRDGKDNDVVRACNPEQRGFVARFLEYVIDTYSTALDQSLYSDDMLTAYEIWSGG